MRELELKTIMTFADIAAAGTLLSAAALLGRSALSRASAATRHGFLASCLIVVLCLPILCALLSHTSISTIRIKEPTAALTVDHSREIDEEIEPLNFSSSRHTDRSDRNLKHEVQAGPISNLPAPAAPLAVHGTVLAISYLLVLPILWLAGVLFYSGRMMISAYRLRREYLLSEPGSERVQEIADIARRLLKISGPVSVRQCGSAGDVFVPVTWGVFKPHILLPAHAEGWSDSNICAALMHELAHIKRSDWTVQMLAQAACVLHWFNPLVWKSASDLRFESEIATDDVVISVGLSPTKYAQSLVDVARSMQVGQSASLAAVAMASPCDINKRVLAILDLKQDRRPVSKAMVCCSVLTLMMIAIPFCAVRVEAQQASAPATPQPPALPTPLPTPSVTPEPAPDAHPTPDSAKDSEISVLRVETIEPAKKEKRSGQSNLVIVNQGGHELSSEDLKELEHVKAMSGVSNGPPIDKKLHIILEETRKELSNHRREIDSELSTSLDQLGPLISKSIELSLKQDAPEIKKAEHLASIEAGPQISQASSQALIELDKDLAKQSADCDTHHRIIIQDNGVSNKSFEQLSTKVEADALRVKAMAESGRSDDAGAKQLAEDATKIALEALERVSQQPN